MPQTSKKTLLVLLPFVFFILFHERLEYLINQWIVKEWFGSVKSNLINDLLFYSLCLIILIQYILRIKRGFLTSLHRVILFLELTVLFSYYRFTENTWHFTSTSVFESVKYLDFILLVMVGEFSLVLRSNFSLLTNKTKSQSDLELDEPIEIAADDLLNRCELAQEIAGRVSNTNGNSSIAFGITGQWGSGKTSFMNLLKNQFHDSNDIIIDFNPWKSLNHELLIRDFFQTLATKLEKYSAKLSKEIHDYANELLKSNNNSWTSGLRYLFNLNEDIDINDRFLLVNETLKKLDKQVIVFIDDLDRLDNKEIVETLKLIRNTGSFSKIKFLVAFDREYVIHSIRTTNSYHNVSTYLDKIFLQTIELPAITAEELNNLLLIKLSQHFPSEREELQKLLQLINLYEENFLIEVIKSVRDIKRFIYRFIPEYNQIKGEVVFSDYFKIRLLNHKFPEICRELYLNRNVYLQRTHDGYVLKQERGKSKTVLHENLEFLLQSFEVESAMKLARNIFPINNYTSSIGHLSIRYPNNFDKYFTGRLDENDLSELEFTEKINQPIGDLKRSIDQWCYANKKLLLMSRFKKLDVTELNSKKDFEKIISAICYLATKKNRVIGESLLTYGYFNDDFYNKICNNRDRISNRFYDGNVNEYRSFLLGLFKNSITPHHFFAEFSHYMVQNNHLDDLPISTDEFYDLTYQYFRSYIESVKIPSNEIWDLYHNSCKVVFNEKTRKKETVSNSKVNELLKNFLTSNEVDWFITAILTPAPLDTKTYYVSEIVTKIFGGYKEFKVFFEELKNTNSEYLSEFKSFIQALEADSFKTSVKFEFVTIPK